MWSMQTGRGGRKLWPRSSFKAAAKRARSSTSKRQYKTLAYGSPGLPALRGGRHWRASPEGLLPVVAPDGALDRGLNLSEGSLLTG